MAEERCERTELLAAQCACVDHRGGLTPQEEAAVEQEPARTRLLNGGAGWTSAHYAGNCARCGERFEPGSAIRFRADCDSEVASDSNWIAECCARTDVESYPDATARRALGRMHDQGVLP